MYTLYYTYSSNGTRNIIVKDNTDGAHFYYHKVICQTSTNGDDLITLYDYYGTPIAHLNGTLEYIPLNEFNRLYQLYIA